MPAGLPPSGQGWGAPGTAPPGQESPLPAPTSSQALLPAAPPLGQVESPLAYEWAANPVLVAADSPDCVGVVGIDGYEMVRRTERELRAGDGAVGRYPFGPSIDEMRLLTTRTEHGGCNVYGGEVVVDMQSGERSLVGASYAVGDLFFSYCKACPMPHSGHWNVDRRAPGEYPNRSPLGLTPTSVGPIAVQQLVAQSSVIGEEEMNGFATVHRRFMDREALRGAIRWQLGSTTRDPLDATTAEVDMWLTRDTHRLVRLRFYAEGQAQGVTGAGAGQRFAITEEFNLTAVDRNTQIVVPDEILAAVAAQLEALEGK